MPHRIIPTLRRLGPAGVVTALASTVPPFASIFILVYLKRLGGYLQSHGLRGAALAAGVFILCGGMMLCPTYSFSALCGWAFGPGLGLATAMVGITGAGLLNYLWARVVCKDRVIALLEEDVRSRAVYDALLRSSPWKTLGVVCLIRLPPSSPFALANVLLAATRVPFLTVLLGTLIGMLPRTAIVVIAAARMSQLDVAERRNPLIWIIGIILTLAVLAVLGLLARKALAKATSQN